jgi:hypothetical protein
VLRNARNAVAVFERADDFFEVVDAEDGVVVATGEPGDLLRGARG